MVELEFPALSGQQLQRPLVEENPAMCDEQQHHDLFELSAQQNLRSPRVIVYKSWQQFVFTTLTTKRNWVFFLLAIIASTIIVVSIIHHTTDKKKRTVVEKHGKVQCNASVSAQRGRKNEDTMTLMRSAVICVARISTISIIIEKPNEPITNYIEQDGIVKSLDWQPSFQRQAYPRSSRYKVEPPEEMGHLNVYINEPTQDGSRRPPQRLRFPVACYNRYQFPLVGPFLNFMPWFPIFADRRTRQTIIYSSAGGVYILSPLVNVYGNVFSVAELIASGYASLVRTDSGMTAAFDIKSIFQPRASRGPGIPIINPMTGGFMGGIPTKYRSFFVRKRLETLTVDMSSDFESEDEDNY